MKIKRNSNAGVTHIADDVYDVECQRCNKHIKVALDMGENIRQILDDYEGWRMVSDYDGFICDKCYASYNVKSRFDK